MTKIGWVAVLVLVAGFCGAVRAGELTGKQAQQLSAAIRQLPGNKLDPSIGSAPLERWLQETFGSGAILKWSVSDCDLKDVDSMCVIVGAARHRVGLKLLIRVGTFAKGVFGEPAVEPQSFMGCVGSKGIPEGMVFMPVSKLSDIPPTLAALRARHECS